jgi:pyocin activator protein PrtN
MTTAFLLMAQYDGLAVIPVEYVCRDYFRHLTVEKFLRKVLAGEIDLPIVRIDRTSQKTAKGIHVNDLAVYLDKQTAAARKECEQLRRAA